MRCEGDGRTLGPWKNYMVVEQKKFARRERVYEACCAFRAGESCHVDSVRGVGVTVRP